ncbi:GNAT family N-acetyltransferase [Luedemannella helvata]|uniref:N-acetyltransferase domain-containing protein n=1 Tax=Luedemannella helvata TaxID=349315 RepID=A0ABP4W2W8_9ACTN
MRPVEIHEAGLLLRPWQADDADAVHRACQDPAIQRWTMVPVPYERHHAVDFTASALDAWATGNLAPLGVFDAATGELLGSAGLVALDEAAGWGEIGYWVAPWARGRGVGTHAARATARWALASLGLRRLVWRAEVGNHYSRLVALRIGVRMEGLQRRALTGRAGLVDGWTGSLLPGELRETDDWLPPFVTRRAATFAARQPTLSATTRSGETITLRPPAERDLADIVAACRDPESIRWTTVPEPYGRTDGDFFIREHTAAQWTAGTGMVCAIADPAGRYAGSMELRVSGDRLELGDVGFLLAPWARGRGYASAALRALTRWGFEACGLARIEWRAYVGNDGSRRVAEAAGFVVEGVARDGCRARDGYVDAWVGALLPTDVAAPGVAGKGRHAG